MGKPTIESLESANCSKGQEFACVNNRDTSDFMNKEMFECYILKRSNNIDPLFWNLLDELGITVIEHIVEEKDQGPPTEWGPYGWYCHTTEEHSLKVCKKNTVWLSHVFQDNIV